MSVKIPGKELTIGGETLVFAPLNAAAVKQYRDEIKAVFVGTVPDIELVAKLAYASLKRNYDDMTMERVEGLVDYGNLFEVYETLMNLSGLAVAAGKLARRVQEEMADLTK